MGKQTKRDITGLVKSTMGDAYDNIKRENENADYLKMILYQ